MNLKIIIVSERSKTKSTHRVIPFIYNSRKNKLICRVREQTNFARNGGTERTGHKEHEETFDGDQSVHYLENGLGFRSLYI